MKIFISYSRRDAGDIAEMIQRRFTGSEQYEVFTDVSSIRVGDIWSNILQDNISDCDLFVAIITQGALQSEHVQNEVLQAQRLKKRIIPCFHRNVRESDIKWGLNKIQGVEFEEKYEVARNLYTRIVSKTKEKPPAPSREYHEGESSISAKKPRSKAKTILIIFIVIVLVFVVFLFIGALFPYFITFPYDFTTIDTNFLSIYAQSQ